MSKKSFSLTARQDLALIESIKRGNEHAFSMLFKKYYHYIYIKIRSGASDEQDAEDMVLEIFEKVYENISKYKSTYAFSTWMTFVAKNHMIDCIRKRKKSLLYRAVSIDEDYGEGEERTMKNLLEGDSGEPMFASPEIKRAARLKIIYGILQKMKPRDAELLTLRFVEGLTYQEIKERLEMNLGTVKATLHRAQLKLVKLVNIDRHSVDYDVEQIYTLEQLEMDTNEELS